jgi:YVTN family beta-propeller protein
MTKYKLIVLHKLEGSFGIYDVQSGTCLKLIRTNPYPHEICLAPDRKKIYIAEMGVRGIESEGSGGHTISVYDLINLTLSSVIDTGHYDRPHGITTGREKLFVTSESTKNLLIYDLDSEQLIKSLYLGQECAHMVSISRDGKIACTANILSNSITVVDVNQIKVVKNVSVPERPEGMVFSKTDDLIYCVCREASLIAIIERKSATMIDKITTGNGPVRIAISDDGNQLIFPLFHSESVQFANTTSNKVTDTVRIGSHPAGICMSPEGKYVFISCEEENTVYMLDIVTHDVIKKIKTGDGADAMLCIFAHESK